MAFERVDLQLQTFNSREDIEALNAKARYQRYFAEQALEILDRGESLPETFNAPFAMWQFGDDLTLLGLSGEVLVDYVILAERTIGPLRLWVAGYCNSLFGYLPTPRVLEEGGYETRGLYLGVGLFAPEAFEQVRRVIELLANRVGRPSD